MPPCPWGIPGSTMRCHLFQEGSVPISAPLAQASLRTMCPKHHHTAWGPRGRTWQEFAGLLPENTVVGTASTTDIYCLTSWKSGVQGRAGSSGGLAPGLADCLLPVFSSHLSSVPSVLILYPHDSQVGAWPTLISTSSPLQRLYLQTQPYSETPGPGLQCVTLGGHRSAGCSYST